jgi:hypothetical protein
MYTCKKIVKKYLTIYMVVLVTCIILNLQCRRIQEVKDFFNREPEVSAVSKVLKTTIPVVYAANVAMAAVNGDTLPQVVFRQGFTSFPGNGILYITISPTYPLPIGSDNSGGILVVGMWSSKNNAILTVLFSDLNISQGTFQLNSINTFPVQRDGDSLLAVYADQDVNSVKDTFLVFSLSTGQIQTEYIRLLAEKPTDSAIVVEQNAWIIDVDTKGTPTNLNDDVYSLFGAGQYVEASVVNASVVQLVMMQTLFTPAIPRNPYDGRGILRDIDVSTGNTGHLPELGTAVLTFHRTNDGKVDVLVATGVYIGSTGKSLPLHLDSF